MRPLLLCQPSRCSYREVYCQSCYIQCQQQSDSRYHVDCSCHGSRFRQTSMTYSMTSYPSTQRSRTGGQIRRLISAGQLGHSPQLRRWGQVLSKARFVKSPEHVYHHCENTAGWMLGIINILRLCLYVYIGRPANVAARLSHAAVCRVSSRKNKQLLPKGLKVKISDSSITQPFLDPIAVLESS